MLTWVRIKDAFAEVSGVGESILIVYTILTFLTILVGAVVGAAIFFMTAMSP